MTIPAKAITKTSPMPISSRRSRSSRNLIELTHVPQPATETNRSSGRASPLKGVIGDVAVDARRMCRAWRWRRGSWLHVIQESNLLHDGARLDRPGASRDRTNQVVVPSYGACQ